MTNTFFNHDSPLTDSTAYRAANVNAAFEAVELGFDRIPAKDPLNHGYHDYLVDSGAADAYIVTFASNAPTAYANGMSFKMKAANANTGASTINVNSIGVKNLTDINGSPLVEGDITTGAILHIAYDGSSFRIIGGRCSTATEFNSAILTKQRTVKSITDLLAIDGGSITNGESAVVNSFYASGTTGGGLFIWNSSLAKSNHNGGTIISPTVPWVGTSGTVPAFLAGTGETDSGGDGCWVRSYSVATVADFGAVSDGDGAGGGTDNGPILAAIDISSISNNRIHFNIGTYRCDEEIQWVPSGSLAITADPGTVIDATNSADNYGLSIFGTAPPSNNVVNLYDRTVRSGSVTLAANASQGDDVLTIPASLGLAAGDIIRISSSDLFNSARSYYWAGELAKVKEVTNAGANDTVKVEHQIYGSYTGANTKIFKLVMPKVSVSGLKILRDGDVTGLVVWEAQNVSIEGVEVEGARAQGIQVAYCYDWSVRNCRTVDSWYLGAGSAYGLQVSSSQHGTVDGRCHFSGGRHAVEFGGYEPCRDFVVANSTIATYHGESDGAFDTHGNCEFYEVYGCQIIGGMSVTPTNSSIHDNTIFDKGGIDATNGGDETAIRYNIEMNSGYTLCRNNKIVSLGGGSAAAAADKGQFTIALLFAEASCVLDLVEIEGCKATASIGYTHGMIHVAPLVVGATGGRIKRFNLINNDMELLSGSSSTSHCIFISDGTHGSGVEVRIDYMLIQGGRYESTGGRVIELNPHTDSGTLEMVGARLIDNDVGLMYTPTTSGNFETARIRNCTAIRASSGASKFDLWGHTNIEFMDNWLENLSTNSGLDFRNATLTTVRNIRLVSCSGNFYMEGQVVETVGGGAHQNKVTWASAAPTSGTWAASDICWNTATSAGGVPGWVCTTGGTPGTWKAMASVAA